jgi:hypothetical protein
MLPPGIYRPESRANLAIFLITSELSDSTLIIGEIGEILRAVQTSSVFESVYDSIEDNIKVDNAFDAVLKKLLPKPVKHEKTRKSAGQAKLREDQHHSLGRFGFLANNDSFGSYS